MSQELQSKFGMCGLPDANGRYRGILAFPAKRTSGTVTIKVWNRKWVEYEKKKKKTEKKKEKKKKTEN